MLSSPLSLSRSILDQVRVRVTVRVTVRVRVRARVRVEREEEEAMEVVRNEGGGGGGKRGGRSRRQKYTKRLPLAVVLEVKESRDRHGLKHHDYSRYRSYLGKRLRRLYSSLGMTHMRGKRFVKRPVNARSIRNDARGLLVPLLRAERCWAAAMETKARQEAEATTTTTAAALAGREDDAESRARIATARRNFVVQKMKRASCFAQCLQRLASRRCNSVSALEAEAYAAWLHGTLEMERDRAGAGAETDVSRYVRALEMFTRARSVYDHLSRRADGPPRVAAGAAACAESRDALEPSIRYCQYKLGEDGGATAGLEALQAIAAADASLQAKLAKVLAQARDEAAEESVREVDWHGIMLPIDSQTVRVCLHGAREIEAHLDAGTAAMGATGTGSAEESSGENDDNDEMELYDALFVHLNDARGLIRQQRAALADSDEAGELLAQLDVAIAENASRRMIQRTEAMIRVLKARVDARIAQSTMGGPREERVDAKDKGARPDDLVRLYENQQQSIEALGELAEASKVLEDAGVLQECVAMRVCVQAHRCYYVAVSYAFSDKFTEAFVLASRAADYVEEAEGRVDSVVHQKIREEIQTSLAALLTDVLTQRCVFKVRAHARALEVDAELRGQVGKMSLDEAGVDEEALPLSGPTRASARLSVFRSALVHRGSDASLLPKLADVPPSLVSLPGRAITLDTAINDLPEPRGVGDDDDDEEYEDEDEEEDDADTPSGGFISSFFGWGGSKK